MNARRSRFSRICRRLTRRTPDRHSQWQQIHQLRPHSAAGHPAARSAIQYIPYKPEVEQETFLPSQTQDLFDLTVAPEEEPSQKAQPKQGSMAVAVLAVLLFLLGCAYAALSGFAHSSNDVLAVIGIMGAIVSLTAALVGVLMATSPNRGRYSGRFLGAATVLSIGGYAVLLCMLLGR